MILLIKILKVDNPTSQIPFY